MWSWKYPYKPQGELVEIRRGSQQPIILKETINLNWNLLRDRDWCGQGWVGPNQITFHGRGMDIFWNNTLQILFTNWYSQFFFSFFLFAWYWLVMLDHLRATTNLGLGESLIIIFIIIIIIITYWKTLYKHSILKCQFSMIICLKFF